MNGMAALEERDAAVLYVAQALALQDDQVHWDDMKPRLRQIYLSDARSAIEAYEQWRSLNKKK